VLRQLDNTRSFSAVILDMDGLMLDTEIVELRAWQRAATDFGWSIPDDDYLQLIGKTDRDAWAALAALWEARPATRGDLHAVRDAAAAYVSAEKPAVKDGLFDLLGWAHREQVPLAVGSSSARETIIARLEQVELHEAFEVIVGGDEVACGKPAPDVFLLAARRLGCMPHACVVIEDSDHGINAAYAAGMTPFLVPDSSIPRSIPPDIRAKAYKTCESLSDVLGVLKHSRANLILGS
jgi:beta-phosphoglucomutase-like phosphatase (HAD superfamily)